MLKNRILSTLKFFDLQDYPLTLLELGKFLVADVSDLKLNIDSQGELVKVLPEESQNSADVSLDKILNCLDAEVRGEAENFCGFYYLPGRKQIVNLRLHNYFFGIRREKLIRRYIRGLRNVPFVRGVALAGSQAMGQEKENSDIDLLIITHKRLLWLARTLVTAYFQVLGLRRHGVKVKNRFCLNHYLAGPKTVSQYKNFYTAAEYIKLRPLVYSHGVWEFQKNNMGWVKIFFPNADYNQPEPEEQSGAQKFWEKMFLGRFGMLADSFLKNWQLPKIRQEKFIVVEEDELSFHPQSKQQTLLESFLHG